MPGRHGQHGPNVLRERKQAAAALKACLMAANILVDQVPDQPVSSSLFTIGSGTQEARVVSISACNQATEGAS